MKSICKCHFVVISNLRGIYVPDLILNKFIVSIAEISELLQLAPRSCLANYSFFEICDFSFTGHIRCLLSLCLYFSYIGPQMFACVQLDKILVLQGHHYDWARKKN